MKALKLYFMDGEGGINQEVFKLAQCLISSKYVFKMPFSKINSYDYLLGVMNGEFILGYEGTVFSESSKPIYLPIESLILCPWMLHKNKIECLCGGDEWNLSDCEADRETFLADGGWNESDKLTLNYNRLPIGCSIVDFEDAEYLFSYRGIVYFKGMRVFIKRIGNGFAPSGEMDYLLNTEQVVISYTIQYGIPLIGVESNKEKQVTYWVPLSCIDVVEVK